MQTEHKIAVIGCGAWGMNYLRATSEMPETRLTLICDQSPDQLDKLVRRFGDKRMTTSVDEVAESDEIEAVIVATTASTHYDVCERLLRAGKHVLVEKPMTIDVEEAKRLVDLAAAHHVKLMVGHIFMFNPGVQTMKRCIDQGQAGTIYYLHSRRTNLGPIRHDVDALWDLATHDVSIFNYLLDATPDWVSAISNSVLQPDIADVGFVTLHYPGNILGNIHVSWIEPNKAREIVVVGSSGRVVFDDLKLDERVRVFEKGVAPQVTEEPTSYGEHQMLVRDGNIITLNVPVSEPLKNQIRHFLQCIEDDVQPITDGQSGLDVVRTMQAIHRSMEAHGAPTYLTEIDTAALVSA